MLIHFQGMEYGDDDQSDLRETMLDDSQIAGMDFSVLDDYDGYYNMPPVASSWIDFDPPHPF